LCAISDQRAADVKAIVAVEAHYGPWLDGQTDARRDTYVVVHNVGLVARPNGVGDDRAAHDLIRRAGGNGQGQRDRIGLAVSREMQRESNGIVVSRTRGDCERVD